MLESQLTKTPLDTVIISPVMSNPFEENIVFVGADSFSQPASSYTFPRMLPRGNAFVCYISYVERSAMIIIFNHKWKSKFFSWCSNAFRSAKAAVGGKMYFPAALQGISPFYHSLLKFHAVSVPVSQPDITATHRLLMYLLAMLKMVLDGNLEGRELLKSCEASHHLTRSCPYKF